jgi:hypothetical protein
MLDSKTVIESLEMMGLPLDVMFTLDDVKSHFRMMSNLYHPDKRKTDNAEVKFKKLKEAEDFILANFEQIKDLDLPYVKKDYFRKLLQREQELLPTYRDPNDQKARNEELLHAERSKREEAEYAKEDAERMLREISLKQKEDLLKRQEEDRKREEFYQYQNSTKRKKLLKFIAKAIIIYIPFILVFIISFMLYDRGYSSGYSEGLSSGYDEGYARGITDAYDETYQTAFEAATDAAVLAALQSREDNLVAALGADDFTCTLESCTKETSHLNLDVRTWDVYEIGSYVFQRWEYYVAPDETLSHQVIKIDLRLGTVSCAWDARTTALDNTNVRLTYDFRTRQFKIYGNVTETLSWLENRFQTALGYFETAEIDWVLHLQE